MAEVRVAYLDNDPIVHVHACALLTGDDNTSIVLTDLREPEAILACPRVRELIDFSQPFAVLLIAIVHFLTGDEDVGRIIATLSDALVPGSYLALSHGAGDFHAGRAGDHRHPGRRGQSARAGAGRRVSERFRERARQLAAVAVVLLSA